MAEPTPESNDIVSRELLFLELSAAFVGSKADSKGHRSRPGISDELSKLATINLSREKDILAAGTRIRSEIRALIVGLDGPVIHASSLDAIAGDVRARVNSVLSQHNLTGVHGLSEIFENELQRVCQPVRTNVTKLSDGVQEKMHFIPLDVIQAHAEKVCTTLAALAETSSDAQEKREYQAAIRTMRQHNRTTYVTLRDAGGIYDQDEFEIFFSQQRDNVQLAVKALLHGDKNSFSETAEKQLQEEASMLYGRYPALFATKSRHSSIKDRTATLTANEEVTGLSSLDEPLSVCERQLAELKWKIESFNLAYQRPIGMIKELYGRDIDTINDDCDFAALVPEEWFPDVKEGSKRHKAELLEMHQRLAPYMVMKKRGQTTIAEATIVSFNRERDKILELSATLSSSIRMARRLLKPHRKEERMKPFIDRFKDVTATIPDTENALLSLPEEGSLPNIGGNRVVKLLIQAIENLEREMFYNKVPYNIVRTMK